MSRSSGRINAGGACRRGAGLALALALGFALALEFALGLVTVSPVASPAAEAATSFDDAVAAVPSFAREIRPILSNHCFKCHGPDRQEAGLRLDVASAARAELDSGAVAIVPGDAAASALLERVAAADADLRMPPEGEAEPLTSDAIDRLRAWIEAGAPFEAHWAYVAPQRPALPAVDRGDWPRTAIDHFVLSRLQREGLAPEDEADRATLLRRVSLDLVGLPPTLAELDAFLADTAADAYERAVDRLLASPQYGVRQASVWLDLARYADTEGYAHDRERTMWPYRDWVVDALNADMPYDQFTIEQLAGDLLPEATAAQRIATGLHRNSRINVEAGVDPEEYRLEAVIDRVNTTAAVWLGATLGCAQCHAHKYDPFTQEDYYRLLAIFNQCEIETTRDETGQIKDVSPREPYLSAATRLEQERLRQQLAALDEGAAADALRERLAGLRPVDALVMQDVAARRPTFLLLRGSFTQPGPEVNPGVPAAIDFAPQTQRTDRLELARWLVDRQNPLTARVMTNRLWMQFFGQPLVDTPDDFGAQAPPVEHPELLDWLAVELMEGQWHVKPLVRQMVTSATYRQSSRVAAAKRERDPENRFYARAARLRLPGEVVRDNALAIGGRLNLELGGPSEKAEVARRDRSGRYAYRRSLYLFWKRQLLDDMLVSFDAPTRDVTCSRRLPTRTPLQALNALNDPVFLDAAAGLAARVLSEGGSSPAQQITLAMRLCVSREPTSAERAALEELYERRYAAFRADAAAADALAQQFASLWPAEADRAQWAAWTLVANTLLNLDETMTRE